MESELPRFSDPEAGNEPYGFIDRFGRIELPGQTWQEGNMFNGGGFMPNCNMDDGIFNDVVWNGNYPDRLHVIDRRYGKVLEHIFYNDAVRRLQAVEQLTLPPEYTTIPNTAAFSRFEHIWGSVLFVRKMADKHAIDDESSLKLQLRTLVSDIAHTTGSHLGDWIFQGVGGAENQHDMELEQYLEAMGINDILREEGIDPKEVIFPDVQDWVEASQPDLCVDRVDYGLREMNRWNDTIRLQGFNTNDFTITPEGMLAMVDQRRARIFAEGFLLLSQEHWSEPTHRFLLDMMMLRTKLFYAEGGAPRSWVFNPNFASKQALLPLHELHPRDLMYVTDHAQLMAFARPSLSGHILDAIMKSVAQYHRQYVWPGRRERINAYLSQFVDDNSYDKILKTNYYESLESPAFNHYLDEYPKTQPLGFSLLTQEEVNTQPRLSLYLDFPQPPFKVRQIDPLVQISDKSFRRLSELDESYGQRLTEHKARMQQLHTARVALPDKKTYETTRTLLENIETHWHDRLQTSRRMSAPELKALVRSSAYEIHGLYPFMTFIDF